MTPSELSVDEDAPRGFSVASVKAYGRKAEDVHYSLAGGDLGGSFDVDKVSGSVFVNGTLDYERVKKYELWVSAFYSSKPLYSVAKVKTQLPLNQRLRNRPARKFRGEKCGSTCQTLGKTVTAHQF